MSLLDDFKARFPAPEFSEAVADKYVPIYEPVLCCYYGGVYAGCDKEIILNLLAHLIASEGASSDGSTSKPGASGLVASKTVGSVSVSYDNSGSNDSGSLAWFNTTKYGQRFLLLTQGQSVGGYVV